MSIPETNINLNRIDYIQISAWNTKYYFSTAITEPELTQIAKKKHFKYFSKYLCVFYKKTQAPDWFCIERNENEKYYINPNIISIIKTDVKAVIISLNKKIESIDDTLYQFKKTDNMSAYNMIWMYNDDKHAIYLTELPRIITYELMKKYNLQV